MACSSGEPSTILRNSANTVFRPRARGATDGRDILAAAGKAVKHGRGTGIGGSETVQVIVKWLRDNSRTTFTERDVKRIKFKLYDTRQANMDLARMLGHIVDRTDAKVDVVSMTCAELEAKYNALPLATLKKLQALMHKHDAAIAAIMVTTEESV